MRRPTPDNTRECFLDVLDEALGKLSDESPILCGSTPPAAAPGEPAGMVFAQCRIGVLLDGRQVHAGSVRGERIVFTVKPGHAIYFVPNAWTIVPPLANCRGLGVVFHPDCVRLIYGVQRVAAPSTLQPYWYHTATPMGVAGGHLRRALDCLAEEGSAAPAARDLFSGLLRLVRQHLGDDVPAQHSHSRAARTWRSVKAYLEDNFARAIHRESVAKALGLHPNYLSALARQVAGESFQEVLEGIRMQAAQRLLRSSDVKLARIAALCGYRDGSYFTKAFRRAVGVSPSEFRGQGNVVNSG